MKLLNNSKLLMSFFLKNKCINHVEQTNKTRSILKRLYKNMVQADAFITSSKKSSSFYKLNIVKITNKSQVPKPANFNSNSFPEQIRLHIDDTATYVLSYTFSLFNRSIKIKFIVEDLNPELHLELYNSYVDKMLQWLYIINEHASNKCSKELTVFLYFTSMKKRLPTSSISVLDQLNVNTAFTTTCPVNSEIVVFRYEEWFKVFIHETFHNFALDFSDMNTDECTKHILHIFPVMSEVNLFEAYTEFWAVIMNSLFCSYAILNDKSNVNEFLSNSEFFINFERTFSFFQMVKVLNFMGLRYQDLYSTTRYSTVARNTLYKENTNVLAYYVIKLIMLNNYQGFLSWCVNNNSNILQFDKNPVKLTEFCRFIERNYKTQSLLNGAYCTEGFLHKFKKMSKTKDVDYLLNSTKMTIAELG